MKKYFLALAVIAAFTSLATQAYACPNGYDKCGERGQLCCPK
jgi:hypothetical protein